jgi:hypothetical protein
MLPSDQVRYRGRYRVRYTPSLHFALHPHCNGSQVVENIGALHVTLQCVAVRCVTPPSIGGVTQQRNATVAEATGGSPAWRYALWVGGASVANVRATASWAPSAAWWLRPTGTSPPLAPVPALASAPAAPIGPGIKNRKIRATAQVGAFGRPLPLWVCDPAAAAAVCRHPPRMLPWALCPGPLGLGLVSALAMGPGRLCPQ